MSFDLDAIVAEERKGPEPDPFTFTFDKQTYSLPGTLDVRVINQFEEGRFDQALKLLAGDKQWAKIVASPQMLTLQSIDTLLGEWAKHCGAAALGKLPRSGGPSKTTAKKSRPTSKGSMASASLRSARKH